MKLIVVQLVLLSIAVQSTLASDVLELKDSDFDTRIKELDVALVEFYAPWCGHCKRLAPEYEKAATVLKSNNPPIPLVKVDCTAETKTCRKIGINGYPTLKIFKKGEVSRDYNGPREANGIVEYMTSNAGLSSEELHTQQLNDEQDKVNLKREQTISQELHDEQDLEKFFNNDDHSIVGFFKNADSPLAKEFKKVADQLSENYRFAHTSNADLLKKANHADQIVIYQPPRLHIESLPTKNVYTGSASSEEIESFIKSEIHGLVGFLRKTNHADFKKPLLMVLFDADFTHNSEEIKRVRNQIISVAKKFKEENLDLTFSFGNTEELAGLLDKYGFENPSPNEKFIISIGPKGEKYRFTGEYSVENLEKFARDFVAGKLEIFIFSEPIPASNDEPVKVVVGKSFNEIVNDQSKDVLIMFYPHWFSEYKQFAPEYDELAKKV
jgi:protein disulfide isomerase family A protein 3